MNLEPTFFEHLFFDTPLVPIVVGILLILVVVDSMRKIKV